MVAFQTKEVDLDFQADRRPEIKAYLERRYNHNGMQRVFSAGTFTTIKMKTAIKDICRVHGVSVGTANYITAIIDNDSISWTDFMRLAVKNKRIKDFLEKYPDVFEEMIPILEQTRSAGIHASAIIVTPEYIKGQKRDCFDIIPIRKMDNILVSELSGYDADALGILKNDCLAIQELTRLSDMLKLIQSQYQTSYTTLDIVINHGNDPKVLKTICEGYTQGVFQMSGDGITRFIKQMKPNDIKDIIALVALFRPGPLDTGAAMAYCDVKNNPEIEPTYLWHTEDVLKDTYGQIVYQEQIAELARKIGNLTLGEGVNLVKAISKKKIEKVNKFKDKFFNGAKENGCPKEAAEEIWNSAEQFAGYAFNHCVAGHESFYGRNNHVGKCGVKFLTIRDMYQSLNDRAYAKEHNRIPIRSLYQKEGYGKAWSMCSDGRARPNIIKDIRYAGIAPIFRITLENGKTLDVTENHRHPTNHGLKMTSELVVDEDEMYCIAGYEKADTSYRFTDKGKLNNERYHSNDEVEHYMLNSRKGHIGFYQRHSRYTALNYYEKHLKKNYCERCGKTDCRLEIHHINGDHSNVGKNFSNLITLCVSCHKKAHYKMGRVKRGEKGLLVTTSKVKSIKFIGIEDTYDVEMEAPNHTFANGSGIITHNSHATAYGLTAYIGAWIKTYYPMPFYSVVLRDVSDDKLPNVMGEIEQIGTIKLCQPDINISGRNFTPDYDHNKIYWSLARIKWVGLKAVDYIVKERNNYGEFLNMEEFIRRIFRQRLEKSKNKNAPADDSELEVEKCAVNTRCVKMLIYAGAFDTCEHIKSIKERYGLLQKAAEILGFDIPVSEIPEGMADKDYFWAQQQITYSGFGNVNYNAIWKNLPKSDYVNSFKFINFATLEKCKEARGATAATIVEVHDKTFKSHDDGSTKHFGKIILQQNIFLAQLTVWGNTWSEYKDSFIGHEGSIIAAIVNVKYSDYDQKNVLSIAKDTFIKKVD